MLSADSLIVMSDNTVKPIKNVSKGDLVKSYLTISEVQNVKKTSSEVTCAKVLLGDGSVIIGSKNTNILTELDGEKLWVSFEDLLENDTVLVIDNDKEIYNNIVSISHIEQEVYGLILNNDNYIIKGNICEVIVSE